MVNYVIAVAIFAVLVLAGWRWECAHRCTGEGCRRWTPDPGPERLCAHCAARRAAGEAHAAGGVR